VKTKQVKDLMLEVSVCKRVGERYTLHQAITALSDPSVESADTKYPMETLLVEDAKGQISGVLTLWDVLAGLEPGYRNIGDLTSISYSGLTPEVLTVIRDAYGLWQKPLAELCRKAARVQVSSIFQKPFERQYIEQTASLDEAIHRLITNGEAWLLVKDGNQVVGLLRICDVFSEVSVQAQQCEP